ncbi:MAG: ABC transporter permease, partial [Gemmatimonadota bacterium]
TGGAEPEQLRALQIEGDLFSVLGTSPMLGRPIQRADAQDRVMVLGHELWTSRFGADSSIIGRTIRLSDQPFTVIGVMPPGFAFPSRGYSLWTSYQSIYAEGLDRFDRGRQFQNVVARLKPGVTVAAARAEMAAVMRRLVSQYPDANVGQTAVAVPLRDQLVGDVRPSLLLLFGAVTFVLLIAAANVANLLVVRALGRTQEIAVRGALGMGQGRLLGLFASEAIVHAGASTVVSVVLAQGLLSVLVRFRPRNVPGLDALTLDGGVVAFAVSVGLLIGLLLTVLPALMTARSNLALKVRDGGRGATGGRRVSRLHESLVVVQVALSLMLLVGAGLLTKSFARLVEVQFGFDPARVTSIQLGLPEARYAAPESKIAAYDRLLASVRAVPGVRAASLCGCWPPIDAYTFGWFTLEGRPDPGPSATPMASLVRLQGDYFSVLGVPIVRGRAFTDRETASEPGLTIISQTLAQRYFGAADPIGKRLKLGQFGADDPWLTVVGVAADVKYTGLAADVAPAIYSRPARTRPAAWC